MQQWVSDHVVLLSVISGLTFIAGLVGAVAVAVVLPENYFVTPPEHRHGKGLARKVLKNVVGVVAVLLGVVMSLPLVPGPGVRRQQRHDPDDTRFVPARRIRAPPRVALVVESRSGE